MLAIIMPLVWEYSWRGILLVVEIIVLTTLYFGLPGASLFFAWFTSQYLRQPSDFPFATEAVALQVLHALFLAIVIWGTIPYYSARPSLPQQIRFCISAIFFIAFCAYSLASGSLLLIMWLWHTSFETAGTSDLAFRCQFIAIFLLAVWCLSLGLFITFLYFETFGFPALMKQMFSDMANLWQRKRQSNKEVDKLTYEEI